MSLPNVNNLVDLINKTRLTEYDKLIKDTYLSSLDIIGNDIQYTYGNKQTKTFTLPVFKGATSDTNGTVGLVPAPSTEDSKNKYLRGDGTWAIVSGSSDLSNWGQARDGITDVNNLPLGFSAVIEGTHDHSPDSFWSTVLTMGSSDNEIYRQQISFPWSSTGDLKIKYRVEDNGTWTDWKDISIGGSSGDASTLNGKTASDFAANKVISTLDDVNNTDLESGIYSVEGVNVTFPTNVISNFFVLIVNHHRLNAGYGTQIAIPYDNGNTIGVFYRNAVGTTWSNWCNISGDLKTSDLSNLDITAKSFTSTTANGFRLVQGNYGAFFRNDGATTYLLFTASGDQYGSWNNLRPLCVDNSSGSVFIGNGLTVSNGFSAAISNVSLNVTSSGTSTNGGWFVSNAGRSNTARSDYTTYQWRNVAASTSATPTTNATYGTSGAIYLQYT